MAGKSRAPEIPLPTSWGKHVKSAIPHILALAQYQNSLGLFADFHSNRHTFITSLQQVGVTPRKAQSLARHCDIRLTMGVYTHIGLDDQKTAIELLPPPPELRPSKKTPPSPEQAGPEGADPADG